MKYPVFIFMLLTLCLGAESSKRPEVHASSTNLLQENPKRAFDEFQRTRPDEVFVSSIDERTRETLKFYRSHLLLPNGLRYGDSVRSYPLAGKSARQVQAEMKGMGCVFKEDVLRSPDNHQPKTVAGSTVPIWIFLCPDGGVVRVKPHGDPTNPWRPHVHGNKSLRFPYNAKFENFSDEVVKIDHEGLAVPKSRAELAPQHLVDGWSADAHADLKNE